MTTMTMMRKDITMMDLTIENGCEVEYPRDPKGRKWMPIEDWAKRRGYRWIEIGEKPKERVWISMEVE